MFANEDLMLKFFYDEGRELTLLEIDRHFTSSDYGELVDVLAALEKKNFIKWMRYEVWVITDIGVNHFEEFRSLKKINAPRNKGRSVIRDAIIAFVIALAVGFLIYWFGWN
jgi:hypothetical protein